MRRIPIQFNHPARSRVRVRAPRKHQETTMRVEIVQGGRVLRQYNHEGQSFIEAPPAGDYTIRLTNNCPRRRLAVISVDGINVVDGSQASHEGPGYVLRAWETVNIKGWRRTDTEVAAFTFTEQGGSYSNQTGQGTKNVGVIGVAVFDEKEKPQPFIIHTHHHHHHPSPWYPPQPQFTWSQDSTGSPSPTFGTTVSDNTRSADGRQTLGVNSVNCSTEPTPICEEGALYSASASLGEPVEEVVETTTTRRRFTGLGSASVMPRLRRETAKEVGTGYGGRQTMFTETTEFERSTSAPTMIVVLRYATRAKLEEWGVPMGAPASPEAFPASAGVAVAAPPGWRG